MNKSVSDIMSDGPCLSREEMLQYLNGTLSDSEQHRVESHLLECELCADAMMGLEGMADRSQLTNIDDQLHSEIDELLKREEDRKVKVLFPWRIAAAFALLFVSTLVLFLVIPKKDEMELFTQEFKPYPAPVDSFPAEKNNSVHSEKEISLNQQPLPGNDSQEQSKQIASEKKLSKDVDSAIPAEDVIADDALSTADTKKEKIAAKEQESMESTGDLLKYSDSTTVTGRPEESNSTFNAVSDQQAGATATMEERVEVTAVKKSRSSAPGSLPQPVEDESSRRAGILAYQQQQYQSAIKYLEKSNNPEAIFYLGLSYLSIDNPHLAITHLEKYLKTGDKKYQEAAWWYSGLSYIKTKNTKSSRKALEKVIQFQGEFEQQATDLLRKL